MRPPHELIDHREFAATMAALPPPAASLRDTAGWQALYQAMLGHITGNVEVWLKNYLADIMTSAAEGRPAEMRPVPLAVPSSNMPTTGVQFAIPPWLEPFQDPANVRFTRTPDHILRREKGEDLHGVTGLGEQDAASDEDLPFDRRPFVPAPGVRYTRTPDRQLGKMDGHEPFVEHLLASTAMPDVTMDALVADAFDTARQAEAEDHGEDLLDLVDVAGWDDVPPQPWGAIIQLGPLEPATVAAEQDNVAGKQVTLFDAAAVLAPGDADVQAAVAALESGLNHAALAMGVAACEPLRDPEPVADLASEDVNVSAIDGITDIDTPALDVAVILDDRALPIHVETSGTNLEMESDDIVLGQMAAVMVAVEDEADRVSFVAPTVIEEVLIDVEPLHVAALADNALHMAFLGGLNAQRPPRRRFSGLYEHPPLELLSEPARQTGSVLSRDALEQHARLLEGVLEDFGIRGEIINVRPGPVVTLYELEPAPGIKSSRVVGLADDIARSMSAISARVAVVQGRNAIGIELPNQQRDMVYLRELFAQPEFEDSKHKLAIALGKTIGGEPVIVDLARMPHLLVAGTTGSGKSVAINTMILSLLYRLKPEECRLIMVDPKMLELSIYDGIPHLLTPVVTDPKKAVIAMKWAVREMEDRYKKMSKVGVRNIDGFNARVTEAKAKGEIIVRTVHTGFDRHTGQATYAQEEMDLATLPYIVIIVDEMADLMMVAGKDIEGAIQRLAQMARAAGIHLIMATQRPSVDVITGTIKANFPTRISFQVTSKIDSRTILGEQGAEQLLGQGDMLHMIGGGRIARVHGPFVSDGEVELVVNHLKAQGQPDYLDVTTEDNDAGVADGAPAEEGADDGGAVFDKTLMGAGADDGDLYDQAVKIVLRDKKCSTSYIQRRLSVGYNKAASLVEKMEKEGIVGPANHAGKREILIYSRDVRAINITMPEDDDDA